jgi:hypothetical protein
MAQADSVLSTPPTNTSAIDHPMMFPPRDPTRRRFLAVAAVGSFVGAGTLAAAAMAPPNVPQAVTTPVPSKPDPAFVLIADKRAADIAHGEAIDAEEEAEEHGIGLDEACNRSLAACHAVNAIDWKLATTLPTSLAGVAAVLRFANEIEDGGMEWPNTDAIGPDGWHYQLRATMAAAIEALINVPAGKAVLS